MIYNYSVTALVLLVHMHLLSEEAAEYLANELQNKIHTARYKDSFNMVDTVLKELEEKEKPIYVEPWLPYIRQLERRIDDLEKQLAAKPKK